MTGTTTPVSLYELARARGIPYTTLRAWAHDRDERDRLATSSDAGTQTCTHADLDAFMDAHPGLRGVRLALARSPAEEPATADTGTSFREPGADEDRRQAATGKPQGAGGPASGTVPRTTARPAGFDDGLLDRLLAADAIRVGTLSTALDHANESHRTTELLVRELHARGADRPSPSGAAVGHADVVVPATPVESDGPWPSHGRDAGWLRDPVDSPDGLVAAEPVRGGLQWADVHALSRRDVTQRIADLSAEVDRLTDLLALASRERDDAVVERDRARQDAEDLDVAGMAYRASWMRGRHPQTSRDVPAARGVPRLPGPSNGPGPGA